MYGATHKFSPPKVEQPSLMGRVLQALKRVPILQVAITSPVVQSKDPRVVMVSLVNTEGSELNRAGAAKAIKNTQTLGEMGSSRESCRMLSFGLLWRVHSATCA